MSHSIPWELVGTFLAVMREGSLSGAARDQQLAQPTVRRRIEALEASLGAVLFTRSSNGLVPTTTAHETLPYAEAMEASAEALTRAVHASGQRVRGTVRLTASEVIATEVLPSLLGPLLAQYPELEIELVPTNRNQNLLRRDADVAVRMVAPTQVALVARRIGDVHLGLFATEGYVAKHGTPTSLESVCDHTLIGHDRAPGIVEAARELGIDLTTSDVRLRSDHDLAQLAAVRAGIGIGVAQVPLAARDGLVRVLEDIDLILPVWIVTHEDLRHAKRIRAVFDHLAVGLASYLAISDHRGSGD